MPNLNSHGIDRTPFLARATRTFETNNLDPERCGALAQWAEDTYVQSLTDDTGAHHRGVIFDETGLLLAHTQVQGLGSGRVVTSVEHDNDADLVGTQTFGAMYRLALRSDLRVFHATFNEVCVD